MNTQKFFNLIVGGVLIFSLLDAQRSATAQESNPNIFASAQTDWVSARNWPVGTIVFLTVNGFNIDSEMMAPSLWNSKESWAEFDLGESEINIGDIVTVTDGITEKSLVVTAFAVTGLDPDADTVSGWATPNAGVWVGSGGVNIHVLADSVTGLWEANFHGQVDLVASSNGSAAEWDSDGDGTWYKWGAPNPGFMLNVNNDSSWHGLDAWNWPLGSQVTLSIDDPGTPQNPDYAEVKTMGEPDPGHAISHAMYLQDSNFQGASGFRITLSDGIQEKNITVPSLAITEYDLDTDTITGTSDPLLTFEVWVAHCVYNFCSGEAQRTVTADGQGAWQANFGVSNDPDEILFDLQPGDSIEPQYFDNDRDLVVLRDWRVPYPEPVQCPNGNSISGHVYQKDGITPIPSVKLQVEDYDTGALLFTTTTDQNGVFACSLPDGEYRILAWSESNMYTQEYYNEAADVNATPIHVISGSQFTNINFTISPAPVIELFTFNMHNLLLQDLPVRQAIAFGTDRQRILNEAFLPNGNYGMVSNSIVVPEHWASAPASELDVYPFDPIEARIILENAGWIDRNSDGFRENADGAELAFTFKARNSPSRMASGAIFQQNMVDIGIRIVTEYLPNLQEVMVQHNFDIAEFAWVSCTDNEPCLGEYVTGSPNNHANYSNPAYDASIENARNVTGDLGKLPYLIEAQQILMQDLPILPLFTRYNVTPVITPIGNNITISPESYLNIHFSEVTEEGVTTVLQTSITPVTLPPNFQLLGQVYDIGTNASFTNAQVCFAYDDTGLTLEQETGVRLFHLENNSWVDVTDDGYPDTIINQVCGTVTSFSPFAVMYSLNQPPTANAGPEQTAFIRNTITMDASASSDPDGDALTYAWDLDNDGLYDDATGVTVQVSFSQVGEHVIGLQVTDVGGLSDTDTVVVTIISWTLQGFYQPIDMNGVYNLVKGGSTVPFKFEIFASSTELTDIFDVKSLTYTETACDLNAVTDEVELTTSGSTSLRYDTQSGQFIYNWKTPSTAGKCYRVTLSAMDGSSLAAYFKLK